MSIVGKIRDRYRDQKPPTGNFTSSRFGDCCAAVQQRLYPSLTHPEPALPRARMMFAQGHREEAWLSSEVEAVFPGQWGLQQFPFYFPVPIDQAVSDALLARFNVPWPRGVPAPDGRVWGTVFPGFMPPKIEWPDGGKPRFRGLPESAKGIILDPDAHMAYLPAFVDGIIRHPSVGLAVFESKAMSNFNFRRAAMGNMGYRYRCQAAGAAAATGLNLVWVVERKETCHLAEITLARQLVIDMTRVEVELLNGQREVYFVPTDLGGTDEDPLLVAAATGAPAEFPLDESWEVAEVSSVFDDRILEEIRERFRRVTLAKPGQWHREYGPSFTCDKCRGALTVRCRWCRGSGISTQSRTGKACNPCGATGILSCDRCGGTGAVDVAILPYPCSYCSTRPYCYPMAELTIEDGRPRATITKAAWDAARLSFRPPLTLGGGRP